MVSDEDVMDEYGELTLDEAREINENYEIGDVVELKITPRDFGEIGRTDREAGGGSADQRSGKRHHLRRFCKPSERNRYGYRTAHQQRDGIREYGKNGRNPLGQRAGSGRNV